MIFSSKAETLKKFSKQNLTNSVVPTIFFFTVKQFRADSKKILIKIKKLFNGLVAVRSSCLAEDKLNSSMAGYFYSGLNINSQSNKDIYIEINKVINSYNNYSNPNNLILIQEMVKKVKYSGVIMTSEKSSYSPYFVIDYLRGSDTSAVTAGNNKNNITFIYFKHTPVQIRKKFQFKLIKFAEEIIKVSKNNSLDIEFALDKKNKIYLLQVRPIVKTSKYIAKEDENIKLALNKLQKKINKLQKPHHSLLGKSTAFGTMPDWNPAEMIGTRPKPLALSLYRELITDTVWANQRKSYGYRDMSSNQLMTTFLGTPYIDIRVDFNSWIPASLNDKIAEKLVNFYISKYKKNIHLHDKIEFELIYTCFNFETSERIKELLKNNFKKTEIKLINNSLKKITNTAFKEFDKDNENLKKLTNSFNKVMKSEMYIIDKIYWLIEDCKRYGTLSFAGLARCGFIAVDILNSIVKKNIISEEDKYNFFSSINTITSEMNSDLSNLSRKQFISKYGHLRPNTYDITSLNYKEGYDDYFYNTNKKSPKKNRFYFKNDQIDKIDKLLQKSGLQITASQLIKFIRESIKSREYAKYLFSKNVNAILSLIKELAKRNHISINDISYIEVQKILHQYYNLSYSTLREIFKKDITINKKNYEFNKRIKLPNNILEPNNIYYFSNVVSKGNFIGMKDVTANTIFLSDVKSQNLDNKIIFIESADPGYDFIFTRKIKGLITKFGGANSHMAIRCAELDIPAAIGIGEKSFESLRDKSTVRLNCKTQKIDSTI